MKSCLIALLLLFGTLNAAEQFQMDGPNQTCVVGLDKIYTVAAFDERTYFTAYSLDGNPIWEAPFSSEILSWKIKDGQLLIFSVARNKEAYFLTCVDANEGMLVWERVIYSPSAQ